MKHNLAQIETIVLKNPNKDLIEAGKRMADKLMLHVMGNGMETAIKQCDYFVNADLFKVQKEYAKSNIDLFARLLQQENMVFLANGGASYFNLPDSQEKQMNMVLDEVRYGMTLRKWIQTFALQAYRCDPMGIIFIEVEQLLKVDESRMNTPKCYPTYKSIYSIYDYYSTGRKLEYVCFKLTAEDAISFGVIDPELLKLKPDSETQYFRFVDDIQDMIVKKNDTNITIATLDQANPLPNFWKKTPAFIVSDIMLFNNPSIFLSPLFPVVELADSFLYDRSVRDLQKKFHGFAKAIEPLLKCGTCDGSGFIAANPCPDCTAPGAEKGTGYKMRTKVSDVTKFDLSVFDQSGFDFNKIFGYVSPDIKGWEKQDASLMDLEALMEMTYWGTARIIELSAKQLQQAPAQNETATKSLINLQPRYAKLNQVADWSERTEKMVADLIGEFWFQGIFKQSSISYGRNYILESPDDIMSKYQKMRSSGAPYFSLDEMLQKYYQALYQNNPNQLIKYLKMLDVEPAPHLSMSDAKNLSPTSEDYNKKFYFLEWADTINDATWIVTPTADLIKMLGEYVKAKNIPVPVPTPQPAPAFN